ncbi:MAG: VIT family protein [Steroidobacteraceae bacterium]
MRERHGLRRINWLRAAVLGANDGIVSTSSLVIGVAAAGADRGAVLIAGLAGLVAGAMSMATGEYVSVSSQADTERSDLARERRELEDDVDAERRELAAIYVGRGLEPRLAAEVATQLMAKDALGAHARDELGISEPLRARPLQAALASGAAFAAGASLPLVTAIQSPAAQVVPLVAALSLGFLAVLGAIAARVGHASILKGALRVTFWGAIAMALTAAIGRIFGVIG